MAPKAFAPEVKIVSTGTPDPPTFATAAEERLHRKQRLASAFRLFAKFGFSEGVAGHITARDPELHDHFWVNPFGMHFGHIRVSDLVLVNEQRRWLWRETGPSTTRRLRSIRGCTWHGPM